MPTLVYFPIAGRGELTRLIGKVGGVDLNEVAALPEGTTAGECGSSGSLPILIDGDLKINESGAMEVYLSLIAPKYANLTAKQRAKDAQLSQLKETCIAAVAGVIFACTPEERAAGAKKDDLKKVIDKHYSLIENIMPEDGFINGLEYPTPADLAIVNICEGYMPFGSAYKQASIDIASDYPKLGALNERVKADADVAAALEASPSLAAAMPTF